MSEIKPNVPLPQTLRQQYTSAAKAAGVLLKELHVRAVRAFLGYRLEVLGRGDSFHYFAPSRNASKATLALPAGLVRAARDAADQDGVSLVELLHTALVWYADQLTTPAARS